MPRTAEQARGMQFELDVADRLDGQTMPGSGNQWHARGDCRAHGLRLSCKATAKRTWGETRRELAEAIDIAYQTGEIPALAVLDEDDEELVVMRLSDLAKAFSGGVTPIPPKENKGHTRTKTAHVPVLLRETPAG